MLLLSHIFNDTNNISFFKQHLDSLFCLATLKQRADAHAVDISLSLNLALRLCSALCTV